jgi:hypothetical protein
MCLAFHTPLGEIARPRHSLLGVHPRHVLQARGEGLQELRLVLRYVTHLRYHVRQLDEERGAGGAGFHILQDADGSLHRGMNRSVRAELDCPRYTAIESSET